MAQFRGRSIKRESIVAFALLFNTFTWYFLGRTMVTRIGYAFSEGSFEQLCLGFAYPASIIASGVVGSIFLARVNKTRFFYVWLFLGVSTAICLAIPMGSSLYATLTLTVMLGVSIGVGAPICLSYFKESVSIENRGKVGGIILFATIFGSIFILTIMSTLDLTSSATLLAMWRLWSLPMLFFVSENKVQSSLSTEKTPPLISVLRNRTFFLYFVAWLMFALVDSLETVVLNVTVEEYRFFVNVEPIFAGFSALIAGLFSDLIGRKRVLIFGFISLGIAYATIGLLPQIWISWLFYFIIDGIALGLLWVLFVVVLWGDLSRNGSEKFYAIGEIPFFLTGIFYLLLAPYLALIPESSAFSLAAFFLFLAVLPLLYAPETLPEKKIKERELRMYIGEAKKIKEKYA
jgi:hypothetical protein